MTEAETHTSPTVGTSSMGNQREQEAVLKATAVRSPLPVMSSILRCPPCLVVGGLAGKWGGLAGGSGRGEGVQWGRGLEEGEGLGEGEGA